MTLKFCKKVVVLHHLIQLDGCRCRIIGRMQHRSDDCCPTNGSFDYFSVGVWDSGMITMAIKHSNAIQNMMLQLLGALV